MDGLSFTLSWLILFFKSAVQTIEQIYTVQIYDTVKNYNA